MESSGVLLDDPRTGRRPREGAAKRTAREAPLPRRLFAEFVGTFALTFVAAGADVFGQLTNGGVSQGAKAVAPALMVMAIVYAIGDVSGAHVNPVVTLAFALRGVFRWVVVPAYWAAQLGGAIAAALVLRFAYGDVADLGANVAHVGARQGVVTEALLTLLLVLVVLNTATRAQVLGPNAAIAVGATIALCGLIALPVSGASMNPARSLGPALVASSWTNTWIYVVGPVAGAVVAVVVTKALHPHRRGQEIDAAEGEHDTHLSQANRTRLA